MIIKDYPNDRAAVFEVKYSRSVTTMEKDSLKAAVQIDDRAYAEALREDYADVICYGIAFYKKRCLVHCSQNTM